MIIHQLAEPPKDWHNTVEMLRFMVQSLSADDENKSTINFLVSVWSYHIANGGITEKQFSAFCNIIRQFEDCLISNYPEILTRKKPKEPKEPVERKGFTVYQGGMA